METEFILYVKNLDASKAFYAFVLNKEPFLDVPGMVEFNLGKSVKLGLMPENGIAKIICPIMPHPSLSNQTPRCELYIKDAAYNDYYIRSIHAGAKMISPPTARDWGHITGYVADFDGHVLAFAGDH